MLRQIESSLWSKARSRAAADDITMQGLLMWIVSIYVTHGLSGLEALAGKYPRPKVSSQERRDATDRALANAAYAKGKPKP